MNTIRMIAFDLFGVLITEGRIISNVLMHLLPQELDYKNVKERYDKLNLGDIEEADFWAIHGLSEYNSIRQRFLDSFELNEDYECVIPLLKQRYRLSILSNFPAAWAAHIMERFHFGRDMSPCVFSGQVGYKKPQRDIFLQYLALSAVPAQQILFIDDRLENLHCAHQLGMATVYYERNDEELSYVPDYTIKCLQDLLTLFEH